MANIFANNTKQECTYFAANSGSNGDGMGSTGISWKKNGQKENQNKIELVFHET